MGPCELNKDLRYALLNKKIQEAHRKVQVNNVAIAYPCSENQSEKICFIFIISVIHGLLELNIHQNMYNLPLQLWVKGCAQK